MVQSYIILKDKEGKWIKTEFSGSNKSNAKIRCYSISPETIVSTLSVPLENIAYMEEKQHVEWVLGFIPIVVEVYNVNYLHVGGVQFVPIKGDFSKSIEMARNESRGNYGGYNLIENNCLYYVRDVLRAGTASSVNVESVIESSVCIVPNEFYDQLYVSSK